MSKKEKRRAARQAFPKAKSPPAPRSRYSGGARPRAQASGSARTRGRGGSQSLRPPTIKRAIITGVILAFIYFALIEWAWNSGTSTEANALISFVLLFVYAGVTYGIERWKYQRKLRNLKGPSK